MNDRILGPRKKNKELVKKVIERLVEIFVMQLKYEDK